MFSTEDIRELFHALPPPKAVSGSLPSLVPASSGQGIITLQYVRTEYERLVTKNRTRISVSDLALDLDVEPGIVLQLTLDLPHLSLLSHDSSQVIPQAERHAIQKELHQTLSNSIISTSKYAYEKGIYSKSFEQLLHDQENPLVYYNDHVCSEIYDKSISKEALDIINRMITNITTDDYTSSDFTQMPGSPPKWLILHHLERLANSAEFTEKVFVRDMSDSIRVQSKQAVTHNMNSWIQAARLSDFAYLDLQVVANQNRGLFDTTEDAVNLFRDVPDVEVVESFALSEKWFSDLMDSKLQALHHSEDGVIDVLQDFDEKVQNTRPGHRRFPESLSSHIQRKAEQYVDNAISQKPDWHYHRFGTVVLTDEQYNNERTALIDSTGEHAASQWQQLKDGTEVDLKFSFPERTDASAILKRVHEALSKEKPIQKASEEKYWATIAELETQNESDFATFWTDRVDSRVRVYNEGLSSIEDAKLRDQLSELFANYLRKELVPEGISKARSQSLVLSRRTKKNVQKFETTLPTSDSNVPAILSILDKFTKKQGIIPSSLDAFKQSMIQDMLRRMSKQQKSSDGPVLFLTLVVVLHAKQCPGIVYATGKYAPKLLKQLKAKLEPEQYEQVEKWKEAAKAGTLSKEDREGMRGMAGS